MSDTLASRIVAALDDPAIAWSLGSFGAIAEYMWSPDEAVDAPVPLARVTPRGAIAVTLPEAVRWLPYVTPSRDPARRRSATALCLPLALCRGAARGTVTELGLDRDALRPQDRGSILFDVGLAQHQVDAMVRTSDPACLSLLRAAEGRPLFAAPDLLRALPGLSPHRVFVTPCGRVEVYGAIPPPDGLSPDGPHTHVLPNLLRHGRTHAANLPIPAGLAPCLTLHPMRPDPDHASIAADDTNHDPHQERAS